VALQPGQTIGRYQIIEPLGTGGMATVYKAYQPSLEREVALKVLRAGFADDPEFFQRFQREARSIAKLRHPHIVQVFDFEPLEGRYVLAMEFLEGGTLKDRMATRAAEGKRLPPAEVARIIGEVADALTHGHELGIVHRDMKPSNVMLSRRDRAVVTDFGIAKIIGGEGQTQTGVGIGTPEYMAPEQGTGAKIDHRADIYSLGVMAYEMLTGRVPFIADTPLAVVLAHVRDPLPLPSSIDPSVRSETERVLMKALAKDPGDRYASATEFADALKATLVTASVATPPPVTVAAPVTAPAARRGPPLPLLAGAGLLALALVGGAVFALTRQAAAPLTVTTDVSARVTEPTSAARSPIPKGELIWQAALDGTTGEMFPPSKSGDETATAIRTPPGAIELEVVKAGTASATVSFRRQLPSAFVAEILFKVRPQSNNILSLAIRTDSATSRQHRVTINTGTELLELTYFEFNKQPPVSQLLGSRIAVPGLQSGREIALAVVVHGKGYAVYLDGQPVIPQVADDRLAAVVPVISFSTFGNPGLVTISGVRVFTYTGSETGAASPAAVPAGARPSPRALPQRGALLWQAALDASGTDLRSGYVRGDAAASEVRFLPGAIEMAIREGSGERETGASFNMPGAQTYVGELDVTVTPGTDLIFLWTLRLAPDGQSSYQVRVNTQTESMELRYRDRRADTRQALTPDVKIPGLQSGRTVTLGAVVEAARYTLFLDGQRVAEASDSRISAPTVPQVSVLSSAKGGTVRIVGARFYELP